MKVNSSAELFEKLIKLKSFKPIAPGTLLYHGVVDTVIVNVFHEKDQFHIVMSSFVRNPMQKLPLLMSQPVIQTGMAFCNKSWRSFNMKRSHFNAAREFEEQMGFKTGRQHKPIEKEKVLPLLAHVGKYNALVLERTCGKTKLGEEILIVAGKEETPIATIVSSGDKRRDRDNAALICQAVNQLLKPQ